MIPASPLTESLANGSLSHQLPLAIVRANLARSGQKGELCQQPSGRMQIVLPKPQGHAVRQNRGRLNFATPVLGLEAKIEASLPDYAAKNKSQPKVVVHRERRFAHQSRGTP